MLKSWYNCSVGHQPVSISNYVEGAGLTRVVESTDNNIDARIVRSFGRTPLFIYWLIGSGGRAEKSFRVHIVQKFDSLAISSLKKQNRSECTETCDVGDGQSLPINKMSD